MRVPDDAVGRTFRCPTCGRKAVVQVAPSIVEAQPVPDDEAILPRPPLLDDAEPSAPVSAVPLDAEPVLEPETDDPVLEPEPDEPVFAPEPARPDLGGLSFPTRGNDAANFAFASPTSRKMLKPERKPRGPERWPWILAGIYATAGLALFAVLIWSVVGDSFRGSGEPEAAPTTAPTDSDPEPIAEANPPVVAKADPPVIAKVDPRPLPKVDPPPEPTKPTPEPPTKTEPKKTPEPKTVPVPKPEPKTTKKTKTKRPAPVPTGPEVGVAPADIVKVPFDDIKKLNVALAQLRDDSLKAARANAAKPAPGRTMLAKTDGKLSVKMFACKFPDGSTDWATVFVAEFVPGSENPAVFNRQLDEINRNYRMVFGSSDADLARLRIQFASGSAGNWRTLSFWEGAKATAHTGPGIGTATRPAGL